MQPPEGQRPGRLAPKWAKKTIGGHSTFSWQAGYGAFSVSHSIRDAVDTYIRNQEQHRATLSFMVASDRPSTMLL